jgi:hypothetical protein
MCLWTDRVIIALLRIEGDVTRWPNAAERPLIAREFEEKKGIPGGCIGAIDGFHVVLLGKPRRDDAYAFWNRKERYSFNILGICDHSRRIRYISCGFPGSAHDMRPYRFSRIHSHPSEFFSEGEYILADSAYSPNPNCVPLFKRQAGQSTLSNAEVSDRSIEAD